MIVLSGFDRIDLAHLARALGRYDAELRRDALRLSRGLAHLRSAAIAEAHEGVDGQRVPDLDVMPHSAGVGPLTLTFDRTAEVLNVSKTTVKKLVRSGLLPVVEVEGAPRVRVADVEEYVAQLEPRDPTGPGGAPPDRGPRGPGDRCAHDPHIAESAPKRRI